MNIIENRPEIDFLLTQLILFGMLNLFTFKKYNKLDNKVAKLIEEFKKVKI